MTDPRPRGRLFRKYVVVFLILVGGTLIASSLVELYFSYQQTKRAVVRVELEQAMAAAERIEGFVKDIERQLRAMTSAASDAPAVAPPGRKDRPLEDTLAAQRELDFLMLLRSVPAITEIRHLDVSGREQLRVSRLALDAVGSGEDFSKAPAFLEAKSGKTYFSPVYFRNESEPCMTIAVPSGESLEAPEPAHGPQKKVEITAAEVDLKAIWDVVSRIRIGGAGYAYVVDSRGHLIAHPDVSLVLQKRDLSSLAQVRRARAERSSADEVLVTMTGGLDGGPVLSAHASIRELGWLVFAEQPLGEALAPLYASIVRSAVVLVLGLALSVLASVLLARRMVAPIQILQQGAARIGAGELGHRIEVRTGDELEALGVEFSRTAAQLQESYAGLEQKVEERTHELAEANAGLTEALAQQTATGEILRVILSSPTDTQPVFERILRSAVGLCGARAGTLFRLDGEFINVAARHPGTPEGRREYDRVFPMPLSRETLVGRAILDRTVVHLPDVESAPTAPPATLRIAHALGFRSILVVPMLREDQALGGIAVSRTDAAPFSDSQIELLKTFADQAVIAIENARLLEELQARNRDLSETLARQTAIGEVVRVMIGSQTDVQSVFDTIARSAVRLCRARFGVVFRVDGELIHLVAHGNLTTEEASIIRANYPMAPSQASAAARSILERGVVQIPDVDADPDYAHRTAAQVVAFRSLVAVPMLREGLPIGTIVVARTEAGSFHDQEVDLLRTFADQAVIAIENARLFQELEARSRELTRSVQELTALGEIGQAVSSTLELDTVLATIVARATELSATDAAAISEYDELTEEFRIRTVHNFEPEIVEAVLRAPLRKGEGIVGRMAIIRQPIQMADIAPESAYQSPTRDVLRRFGYRALLAIPLLREDQLIGALVVSRKVPGEFSADAVDLLTTFAAQSAVAIHNARLYAETKRREWEATKLYEITGQLASSLDPDRVLDVITAKAVELLGCDASGLFTYDDVRNGLIFFRGVNLDPELTRHLVLAPGEGVAGRAFQERRPVWTRDHRADPSLRYTPGAGALIRAKAPTAYMAVPIHSRGEVFGVLVEGFYEPHDFTPREIQLLSTLADHAAIALENARLFKELQTRNSELTEALEQQTATAEILRVINSSPTNVQPVFDAIVEGTLRLCDGLVSAVYRLDGDRIHLVAHRNLSAEGLEEFRRAYPLPVSAESLVARTILDRTVVHLSDAQEDPGVPALARRIAGASGYRGLLLVPMVREGTAVGAIGVARREAAPFSEKQVQLLRTFADQAVIAMENLRLFKALEARNSELTDALEQQTAIAHVLRVIGSSPTDLQPVYQTILSNVTRLCEANFAALFLYDGEVLTTAAHQNASPALVEHLRRFRHPPGRQTATRRAALERRPVHIHDAVADPEYSPLPAFLGEGLRTVLAVPMLRESTLVGVITTWRREVRPFTEKQIALVKTFADQAVIAIESARLFQELQARNRDLAEALEQQTVTSEILRVTASSPTDLQPVLDAVAEHAARVCSADDAIIHRIDGDVLRAVAHHGPVPLFPPIGSPEGLPIRGSITGRAVLERRAIHIHDVAALSEAELPVARRNQTLTGQRTTLAAPLLSEGVPIGTILIRRLDVRPFTDKQIEMLKTFADQAVIAIESARLFRELQARNRDLAEALEHQTATNEVLSVMSRSTFDLEPVLETIIENGTRLCGAELGFVYRFDGEVFRLVAGHDLSPEFKEFRLRNPIRPGRGSVTGRTALERRTIHIHDVLADAEYDLRGGRQRTVLGVPMLKEGALIGVITLAKTQVEPFSDKQIELVTGFADQAAIAIEHVRLFQELDARTRELTRSVEELRALGEVGEAVGSTLDVQTVLTTIVARAAELSGSDGGTIHEFDEATQTFRVRATHHITEEHLEAVRAAPIRLGEGAMGRAAATRATVQVADILDEREPVAPQSRDILARLGYRSLLAVPLLREDRLLGGLVVWREERGNFPNGVVSLLETFAAQSVIAIQNARLFEEVREKSREIEVVSRNIERLYRLSTAMQEPLSLREQLHRVLENAGEVVGIDRFYAWVVAPDGDKIVNLVGAGMSEAELQQFEGHEIPFPQAGALYEAYRDGVPLVFTEEHPLPPELHLDPKYLIPPLRTKRFLVVPMIARGATVGLLVGDNKPSGRPILPHTVDLLQIFASHAAVAIANARLFQAIDDKSRQLEAATRAKSQFLANMSHELRTPLNAILGYTELITDNVYGDVPEKIGEVLQRVEESGRHLLGLINDVLDLSKIEAGQLTLALADYSMDEIVQSVSVAVNALAAAKNLELVTTVPPDLPLGCGDARRLRQVLLNLVGNAIKFTEVGQVATRVSVADGSFVVSVADTGPGIAPADQQKIFEEFQQADSADSRKKGGTGLGLAIARRIVEMHGGQLWVESMPGQGSTFWFRVPIRVEQPVAPVRHVAT